MPVRATKRGAERTRLERDCDVLVCGASFAGLAVARELAGAGARVLVIDRYEIGERQTSACAMPTQWLQAMELHRLTAPDASTSWSSTRRGAPRAGRCPGRSRRSTTASCARCCGQRCAARPSSRPPRSPAATGNTVHTDRGELSAPLIVDALGWRRVLSNATPIQPPNARLSRGLEVHPPGSGERDGAVDRSPLRPRRLRLELPRARRAARRRRLVLARAPRQGADRAARRRPGPARGGLPGQLDPPPAAAGRRGRRVLRRRLRRALPAADRRGHPHGALLRPRLRARAARGARGRAHARRRRCARYGAFSDSPRAQVPLAAARCSAPSGRSRRAGS